MLSEGSGWEIQAVPAFSRQLHAAVSYPAPRRISLVDIPASKVGKRVGEAGHPGPNTIKIGSWNTVSLQARIPYVID